MKKTILTLVLALLCPFLTAKGQDIKPLKIGDTIPEYVWNMPLQVVNHPSGKSTIKLNDYRDKKLIIIDFWATWCSSCVKMFPELYSLQNLNNQHLKIILINSKDTKDDSGKISRFLSQRKAAYQFTSVVEDTVFNKLFPHTSIPQYSWIIKNKVVAITDANDITNENVGNVLNGGRLKAAPVKIVYDPKNVLFQNRYVGETPNFIYKSVLGPYHEGLSRRMYAIENDEGLVSKLTITNSPLIDFYRYAYPFMANFTFARIIFNIPTPSRFNSSSTTSSWEKLNVYNYEALFPPVTRVKAFEILQADLNKFFGYGVSVVERVVSCWVLSVTNERELTSFPKTLLSETNLFEQTGLPIFYNNLPLQSLVFELERIYEQPFIDETKLAVPVTLSLPAQLLDSVRLQSNLSKQGLSLKKENRKIPMVIFSNSKSITP